MGRRLVIAGGLTLVGLLALWAWEDGRTVSPEPGPDRVVTRFTLPADGIPTTYQTSASNQRIMDSENPFVAEIEGIAASCGLEVRSACADGVCVALTRVPDLDGLGGWVAFVRTSPWFVVGTAARDLGLPRGISGCAEAVGGLTGQASSVALPGGDEVWCASPDASAAARLLCGRAASVWFDADARAWSAADLRVLRF